MGNNHGFAVLFAEQEDNSLKWLGEPKEMTIPGNSYFSLKQVLDKLAGDIDLNAENMRITLGIDAPLGFPRDFRLFLQNGGYDYVRPKKEIYNPLAYRETDRHIYEKFGKKPLSAVFDRIGTNATVAIAHARRWVKEYGFTIQPASTSPKKNIIEVYPALLKEGKSYPADPYYNEKLPESVDPGSDAYDASLCALMAAGYASVGKVDCLPRVVSPREVTKQIKSEGWIFYFDE